MAENEAFKTMKKTFAVVISCLTLTIIACASTRQDLTNANSANQQADKTQSNDKQQNENAAKSANTEAIDYKPLKLTPHKIAMASGKSLILNLPADFEIVVAAEGLKRPRFFAKSPDNRIFLTTMYNRADNKKGAIYILDEFDAKSGKFKKVVPYLTNLRNPNSIAFYTDKAGIRWFYIALTDRLIRYQFTVGEIAPSSEPEELATFPDYGLNYKYGGWHLTRTLAFNDKGKLYVSVGSSCNICEETEEIRATVLEMDADGKNQKTWVRGLRNAVGMKWANGQLFATNMGQDKLGDDRPDDTMYIVEENKNYGWPYCYSFKSQIVADNQFSTSEKRIDCKDVPAPFVAFAAHSSPLGLEYFDASKATDARLKNSFLVALHGASKRILKRGYRLARVRKGHPPHDFLTGFLQGATVFGRPADVFQIGANAFLFTDDHAGRVFYVYKKAPEQKPEVKK
jgi:glucose/arabinose dehydrogenase